jgi:hypothetical protein
MIGSIKCKGLKNKKWRKKLKKQEWDWRNKGIKTEERDWEYKNDNEEPNSNGRKREWK